MSSPNPHDDPENTYPVRQFKKKGSKFPSPDKVRAFMNKGGAGIKFKHNPIEKALKKHKHE